MLPSVSAGSAALTKYAQAVAINGTDTAQRDRNTHAQAEQETARQSGRSDPGTGSGRSALADDARAAAEKILEILRLRVLTALLDLGISQAAAEKAAAQTVNQLADAIVADPRHAAAIVHALLTRDSGNAETTSDPRLLIAARDLTILIDRQTQEISIHLPQDGLALQPAATPVNSDTHLVDFTDRNPTAASPVLSAFNAINAIAEEISSKTVPVPKTPSAPSTVQHSPLLVSPDAFVAGLTARFALPVVGKTGLSTIVAEQFAQSVSRIIATAINAPVSGMGTLSTPEIVATLSDLIPVPTASNADTPVPAGGNLVFANGRIAIGLNTQTSAVTVTLGNNTAAYAPVTLPAISPVLVPLPDLATVPMPIADIPAGMPVGTIVNSAAGEPFVPPAFEDAPPSQPYTAENDPARPADAPKQANASIADEEFLRMLDPVVARQATVVKGYSGAAGAENAAITQVSLDINAEIGPAPSASLTPTERGSLGRPRDIPPRSEAGPVRDSGYTDATATLPPVLAAFHARGNMELPLNKPKQKKLPKPYAQPVLEDAFTREIPEGHEGLVFTAVVFSA